MLLSYEISTSVKCIILFDHRYIKICVFDSCLVAELGPSGMPVALVHPLINCSLNDLEFLIPLLLQVEKLIKELPTTASDLSSADIVSLENSSPNSENSLQHVESGANLRETQSILLERIASEMNRLKFYIANAKVYFTYPELLLYSII